MTLKEYLYYNFTDSTSPYFPALYKGEAVFTDSHKMVIPPYQYSVSNDFKETEINIDRLFTDTDITPFIKISLIDFQDCFTKAEFEDIHEQITCPHCNKKFDTEKVLQAQPNGGYAVKIKNQYFQAYLLYHILMVIRMVCDSDDVVKIYYKGEMQPIMIAVNNLKFLLMPINSAVAEDGTYTIISEIQ